MSRLLATDPWFSVLLDRSPDLAGQLAVALADYNGQDDTGFKEAVTSEACMPWSVLSALAERHPDMLAGIAGHPNADSTFVRECLTSDDVFVGMEAASSPVLAFRDVENAVDPGAENHAAILRVMADRSDVRAGFLSDLLDSDPEAFCLSVAGSPGLTDDLARRVLAFAGDVAAQGDEYDQLSAELTIAKLLDNQQCPNDVRAAAVLMDGPWNSPESRSPGQVVEPALVTWLLFMLPDAPRPMMDALVDLGHPAGMLYEFAESSAIPDDAGESLRLLRHYEIAQRALWPMLTLRADGSISSIPSELDAEACVLQVGDLDNGIEHNFAEAIADLGYAYRPRNWVEVGLLPEDFTVSRAWLEDEGWDDSEPLELARFMLAYAFAANGFLGSGITPDLSLTDDGLAVLSDMIPIYDTYYPARARWEHVVPFTWSGLALERKRAFLNYVVQAASSDDADLRLIAMDILIELALLPYLSERDLGPADMETIRGVITTDSPSDEAYRPRTARENLRTALALAPSSYGDLDAEQLHTMGQALKSRGHAEASQSAFRACLNAGGPYGLDAGASYAWQALRTDTSEDVVDAVEGVLSQDQSREGYDLTWLEQNLRSNLALCWLANGGAAESSRQVWEAYEYDNHVESLFFPAVLDYQAGNEGQARRAVKALSEADYDTLVEEFTQEVDIAQGWFRQWCLDCLETLRLR